jgi:hypothetical protein
MGVTSDIGQGPIDAVWAVAEKNGMDSIDGFLDWCYPCDNHTLCGICAMCEDQPSDEDYAVIAQQWIDDGVFD